MSGPEQDYSQWNQNQAPPGGGQPPPWNAGGQGQPPPWPGGQQWSQPNAYAPQAPVMIKNYRTQAIVTLILSILFCWFGLATGIPALIYSTRVTESIGRGDYPRAVDASRKARLLSWISVGIIAFFWVIILIILVVTLSHNSPANTGTTTGNTGAANT
jgi:Interferon-induced transmembrane protein